LTVPEFVAAIHAQVNAYWFVSEVRLEFKETNPTACFVQGRLTLARGYRLHVAEYVLVDTTTSVKYRFHLQDASGSMVARWDNVPHYPHISTHPHHVHTAGGDVLSSPVRSLVDLLAVLEQYLPQDDER
jgi:hypothetical protein